MRVGRYINEVCLLFGVRVLIDVSHNGYALNEDFLGALLVVKVALGVRNSQSEAIMTKWYSTEEELDEFCELNINRFRIAASQSVLPDATDWR